MSRYVKPEYKRLYNNARRNLIRNLESMRKRGYDVSKIIVPERPDVVLKKDIDLLLRKNQNRYSNATKIISVKRKDKTTGKKITEVIEVSGKHGRMSERAEAGRKGAVTRKLNKKYYGEEESKRRSEWKKDLNRIENERRQSQQAINRLREEIDRIEEQQRVEYIDTSEMESLSDYAEYEGEDSFIDYTDPYNNEYMDTHPDEFIVNAQTGEIQHISEVDFEDYNSPYMFTMGQINYRNTMFNDAMAELDVMIQYDGTPDDSRSKISNTHRNAQDIKNFITDLYNKDPERAVSIMVHMMEDGRFHSVTYMYGKDGYERFLSYYDESFGVFGTISGMEDYDDSQFE